VPGENPTNFINILLFAARPINPLLSGNIFKSSISARFDRDVFFGNPLGLILNNHAFDELPGFRNGPGTVVDGTLIQEEPIGNALLN
jgi:hypothetical protein